jgi:purine-binding chemotaxis protein CheW
MTSGSKATANRDRGAAAKYLTFQLGEEEYGIGVIRVREIMGVQHITHVPQTPPHVRGVINLRGRVIPVVDMREKLGFPPKEYDKRTCIVVVSAVVEGQDVMTGVVVDSVSEVASIGAEEIEAPPSFGAGVEVRYLHGLARTGDRVKMLLNIDQILDAEDALLALPETVAAHHADSPAAELSPAAAF